MIKLKGKAENLDILSKYFSSKKVIIPEYFHFTIQNFIQNKRLILKKIEKKLKFNTIILRSSTIKEDQKDLSNAGKYDSKILKKNLQYPGLLNVIENYIKQFKSSNDKIIVQNLIKNVNFAGVIFTKDINYNSPYYILNYDNTGKTNLVTSGVKNKKQKTLVIFKKYKNKKKT